MNLALLNSHSTKQMVIKNTFPMKVTPKIIHSTQPTSKSFPNFKILPPTYVTYEIKPTTTIKNDKVGLLLDTISDSYTELFQVSNQFKWTDKGLTLPTQNKLFFETCITNKTYKTYVSMLEHKEQETLQTLNFAWHKSAKIKAQNELVTLDNNCIGFEFKLKHTTGLSLSVDQRLKEKPIRELLEQSKLLKDTEQIFIQFGLQPAEFDWWKEADKRVKSVSKRLKVTETTTSKLGCPAFDCSLRVIIKGENTQRSEMLSRGTIMALKQLNGDNELVENRIKQKKLNKWFEKYIKNRKIETHFFRFSKRMLMTRKEIRHFIKLPERSLQVDFELGVSEREELKIHSLLRKKDGILIGHTEDKGKKVDIRIPKDNLDMIMQTNIILGSPRMGKDNFGINLVVENALHLNAGAFIPDVIDEKGNGRGMCDSLRSSLPPDRLIDLNLADYFNPIYFGLEDVAKLIGVNGMNVIADNFVRVLDLEDTTDSQELCSLIAKVCKCNIYEMYCCLKSKQYANSLYEIVKEEDELMALEYKHEFLNAKKDKAIHTVKTRLKMILGNPHFKHMIAQDNNKDIDFEKWIRERKVVLFRMDKMAIGEIGVKILMFLISMKVFWIKKIIKTDDPTLIVFNEPHQYMSDGFQELAQSMMTEAPKYRLMCNWIIHNPYQLPQKLYEIMKSSSSNVFLFKNSNRRIYVDYMEQLKPIEIDTAMETEKWESLFLPFIDGKQLEPIFVKMLPPPKDRIKVYDNEYLTQEHSKFYGRNVNEVREKILETELAMYAEKTA
jgi:hypothetical protein